MAASELRPLPLNSPSPSPQEEALLGRRELRQNQNKAQQAGSGRVLGSRLETAKPRVGGQAGRQAGAQLRAPDLRGGLEPSASTSPALESGQLSWSSRWGNRKFNDPPNKHMLGSTPGPN